MTRLFNGRFFTCDRPGHWYSDDGTTSIHLVVMGTKAEQQWEVYEDPRGSDEPMNTGDLVGFGPTMKEAIAAWAK